MRRLPKARSSAGRRDSRRGRLSRGGRASRRGRGTRGGGRERAGGACLRPSGGHGCRGLLRPAEPPSPGKGPGRGPRADGPASASRPCPPPETSGGSRTSAEAGRAAFVHLGSFLRRRRGIRLGEREGGLARGSGSRSARPFWRFLLDPGSARRRGRRRALPGSAARDGSASSGGWSGSRPGRRRRRHGRGRRRRLPSGGRGLGDRRGRRRGGGGRTRWGRKDAPGACHRRGRRRGGSGLGGRAGGQQPERVDVAVRVGAAPDPEVHVGLLHLRLAARADGADGVALGHLDPLAHCQRAEVDEGRRVAVGGLDGDGEAVPGHAAREGDSARRRRRHRRARLAGDVDASMLPGRVRIGPEEERSQQAPLGRP
jgi:hypothetical protein